MHRGMVSGLLLLLGTLSAAAQTPPPKPRLGTITFPTSASPAAQEAFLEGVLYLHSFEYESAERAFRRAQQLEPGFAMAHWGEAFAYAFAACQPFRITREGPALAQLRPVTVPDPEAQAVPGKGAQGGAQAAVQHQVNAAVHHPEDLDAAAAGGTARDIRAGADERLIQRSDEVIHQL